MDIPTVIRPTFFAPIRSSNPQTRPPGGGLGGRGALAFLVLVLLLGCSKTEERVVDPAAERAAKNLH
jgi:hypothetical protein